MAEELPHIPGTERDSGLTPKEIARHCGVDHKRARTCQDWAADMQPHITISELVLDGENGEAEIHPFRVADSIAGTTHTRIPHAALSGPHRKAAVGHIIDHDHVKSVHADALSMSRKKNLEIVPLVFEALPELDPEQAAKFLRTQDGNVYDLSADGRVTNGRPMPELPVFLVDGNRIVVDASGLIERYQTALAKRLAGDAKVIAPLAKR